MLLTMERTFGSLRRLRPNAPLIVCVAAAIAVCAAACGGGGDESSSSSPSSSGTSSGGGGGSGPGSSSSTGGPFTLCQEGMVGLQGSLDGASVEAAFPRLRTRVKGSLWQAFFQTQGHVALFGESDLEQPGSSAGAQGLFRMPSEGPHGGEWFCAGSGTQVTVGAPKTFKLASTARLGPCPGTPVTGEVVGCFGGDVGMCPKGTTLTSTLKGAEFDWTSAVTGWGGMPGLYEIYLNNGGILALYIELDTVLGGLLYIAPGSPDEGAAYCFSGGSLQPGGQSGIAFTLSGLSRLGTCADAKAVEGALEGCTD